MYEVEVRGRRSTSTTEGVLPMTLPDVKESGVINRPYTLLSEQDLATTLSPEARLNELFSKFNPTVAILLLSELVDLIPIPIAVTDCALRPRLIYNNPAWNDRWGSGTETRPGCSLSEALGIVDRHPLISSLSKAGETGQTVKMRDFRPAADPARGSTPTGRATTWAWDVLPLLGADDRPMHLLVVLREGVSQRSSGNSSISPELTNLN
ncbi:MAG: hypothetical protein ACREN8_12255, partial [Candidatus Dormibacteraceae bacterium]